MKLIIPLAGKGTRLRPHTLTKPKPLLKVAGKTILEHLLKNVEGLRLSEVIFITNKDKEKIEEFVRSRYKFKSTFVEQVVADGSAGAIRLAKDIVDEDVLIIFSDCLFDADLSIVVKAQKDNNISGMLWVKEVEDYQRFGVVVVDKEGIMTRIVEKPKEPISKLANIGAYYIKDYKLMFEGIEYLYKNKKTLNGEYFLVDAFQYMIDHGSRIITAPVKGWYDCGRVDALLETNQVLLKRDHMQHSKPKNSVIIPPVFIDKDVTVDNSIIGRFVSIASGSIITNCILQNSIIDVNCSIDNIKIKDSIIGEMPTLRVISRD